MAAKPQINTNTEPQINTNTEPQINTNTKSQINTKNQITVNEDMPEDSDTPIPNPPTQTPK